MNSVSSLSGNSSDLDQLSIGSEPSYVSEGAVPWECGHQCVSRRHEAPDLDSRVPSRDGRTNVRNLTSGSMINQPQKPEEALLCGLFEDEINYLVMIDPVLCDNDHIIDSESFAQLKDLAGIHVKECPWTKQPFKIVARLDSLRSAISSHRSYLHAEEPTDPRARAMVQYNKDHNSDPIVTIFLELLQDPITKN